MKLEGRYNCYYFHWTVLPRDSAGTPALLQKSLHYWFPLKVKNVHNRDTLVSRTTLPPTHCLPVDEQCIKWLTCPNRFLPNDISSYVPVHISNANCSREINFISFCLFWFHVIHCCWLLWITNCVEYDMSLGLLYNDTEADRIHHSTRKASIIKVINEERKTKSHLNLFITKDSQWAEA